MLVLGWVAHHPDRHNLSHHLSHSEAKNSFPGYSNPELDSLLDQAAIEQADAIRASTYHQAEKNIVDAAPRFTLWSGPNYVPVKLCVGGYDPNPPGIPDLNKAYVEQQRFNLRHIMCDTLSLTRK